MGRYRFRKFQDLTGQQFGRLKVLRYSHHGDYREIRWLCLCECGTEKDICGDFLKKGSIRSCGCLQWEHLHKHLPTQVRPGATFRGVLSHYKMHAKARGLSWELTDAQFRTITSSRCFYTGIEPVSQKRSPTGEVYYYNGIDRLDNSVGYTPENCVACCPIVNMMKKTLGYEAFMEMCAKITTYRQLRRAA